MSDQFKPAHPMCRCSLVDLPPVGCDPCAEPVEFVVTSVQWETLFSAAMPGVLKIMNEWGMMPAVKLAYLNKLDQPGVEADEPTVVRREDDE